MKSLPGVSHETLDFCIGWNYSALEILEVKSNAFGIMR